MTPNPAVVQASWISEQVDFILSKQLPSGAILSTGTKITPYFANIAALGLLAADTATARAGVRSWMGWYLGHRNAAATNVPAESVFDYVYDPATGAETATGDFDSVDSYASTALNLAYRAFASGDPALQSFVAANIGTYEAIANLTTYGAPTGVRIESGPEAGLTIAKPTYAVAYTMDNSEVYSGLADFAALETLLGRSAQATYYASWAASTQAAIVAKLWNPTNGNWDASYASPSSTSVFYAPGVAQLWPIIFGVVAPSDPKAASGWGQFSASFPSWHTGVIPDSYPWVSITRAAQLMGEPARAESYLADVHARFAPNFTQPTSCGQAPCGEWYDAEAGWFLLGSLPGSGL
ncbi:MGH1-like glycoside hydrolase domain-containing protein [Pengzhenrongella phosphoraccumulans]|uniref:MGH1-like glycoside hydrolase domain-containing protein n=1 Tax=Pengzhenrongella phosphoraccumulans TaxID=3114394 RepID=UPI00388F90D2